MLKFRFFFFIFSLFYVGETFSCWPCICRGTTLRCKGDIVNHIRLNSFWRQRIQNVFLQNTSMYSLPSFNEYNSMKQLILRNNYFLRCYMLRAIHSSIIIIHDMECGMKENNTMDNINMLYDIENITQDMIKNNTVDMGISHSSRNVTQEMITTNRTEIYRNITTEIYRNVTEVEDSNMLYDIENITQDMIKNNTVDMGISHSSRNVTQEMITNRTEIYRNVTEVEDFKSMTTDRTEIYRNITTEIYRNVTEVEDSKSITKHILKNADFIYSQNNYIQLHNSTNTSNIEYTRSLNPNDGNTQTKAMENTSTTSFSSYHGNIQTEAMEKEIATSTISFSSYHNTKANVTLEIFNSETKDTLLVTPTYGYDITQAKDTYSTYSFNILISCILFLVFMYIFFIIGMYTWWKKHGYRNITSTGIYDIYIYIYVYYIILYYIILYRKN